MTSLFSTFDPQSWFNLNLNWTAALPLMLVLLSMATYPTHSTKMLFGLLTAVKTEFKAASLSTAAKDSLLPMMALFLLIAFLNAPGLLPYVFTLSSHLSATASLALPLWIGHMILGTLSLPATLLAHVVPLGAPSLLIPFMILIELVSNVIRPLTLSVRLAANMIAGHLLISLLGQAIFPSLSLVLALALFGMVFLALLESGVSVIQAYVLSLLSSLYLNEMQNPGL